jgi:uncharacterized membrane protein YhaH (DUF805 family)
VLVLQRFMRGQRRWYWLAVGFHSLANAAAVLVAQKVGAVAAEGAMTVVALLALWIILRLRSEEPPSANDSQ